MKFYNLSKSLLLLVLVLAVSGCKEEKRTKRTREYNVMIVQPTSRKLTSTYSATIQGKQDIDIRTKVQGYITDVHVKEGSVLSAVRHSLPSTKRHIRLRCRRLLPMLM